MSTPHEAKTPAGTASLASALATIEKLSTIELIGNPRGASGCFARPSTKDVVYASGDIRNGSLTAAKNHRTWVVPLKSSPDGAVCSLTGLQNVRVVLGGVVYAYFGHPDSCSVYTDWTPNPEIDTDHQKFLVFELQEKVVLDSIVRNWPKERQDLNLGHHEPSEFASQLWAEESTHPPNEKTVSFPRIALFVDSVNSVGGKLRALGLLPEHP